MTLINFEGFETVGTLTGIANQATTRPRIALRWDASASGGAPATDSYFLIDDKDALGYAVQMGSNSWSNGNYFRWLIPAGYTGAGASGTTFIMGMWIHIPDPATTWTFMQPMVLSPSNPHLHWVVTNSADISVSRNLGGVLGSKSGVFTPGQWHYVECKWLIGNSPYGLVECYVDDALAFSASNIDTQDFYGSVGKVQLYNCAGANTSDKFVAYDDIYFLVVDATVPNTYLGSSVKVETLPPNGDSTVQFSTSTGSTHYTLVDENGADATDNVYTSVDAEVEMFDMTNTTEAKYIYGVKVEVEGVDDLDAGANNIDVRIDSGGTVSETNHNVTNTSAYDLFTHLEGGINPDTGSAWTKTEINALLIGLQYNT